ncbi:MAG: alpha/beta hydrolase [Burkholderiaceae bacterium]|jgi:arylformamidase|nr:alpha/beta hydrolase [Burkholderiaceae bacterium]MDP4969007.1 alpha/beta hydrolase [Burkholderiaceae bacterium]MDP5111119.1 alpha/beta hydrolase [Burkholderiaceae bacterium]
MNEAIEKQYNPRATVTPEHLAELSEFDARLSEQTRQKYVGVYDLRFGEGPLETADFFYCGKPNRPLMVFFHGGYWRARDKKDYSFIANGILPLDCSLVVMNYDLCPAVTVQEIVRQTKRGLEWVARQAAGWQIDPAQLYVSGHSAGAHIIAATLAQTGAAFELKHHKIKKAYLISGVFDVEPVLQISVNEEVKLKPEDVAELSPIRYPFSSAVGYEVIVGGVEPKDWIGESERMAAHLRAQGCEVGLHILPGLHHFSVLHEMDRPEGYVSKLFARDIG